MIQALTTKRKLFIQRMTESEEQAQWGFELLLKRPDFDEFFDHLHEASLFAAENNRGPVPADQPGYVHIPFWYALNYLQAVAKRAGEKDDLELAKKVMTVVRTVSGAREPDGSIRDNYHTYRMFAEILGLVPTASVTQDDLDLIPGWLGSKYERGMVGYELGKDVMPRFLASVVPDDWSKACKVLEHCTVVRWLNEKELGDTQKKPTTIVNDHWLKELISNNAKGFGVRSGKAAAEIFLARLREVFGAGIRKNSSWLSRPAVEDHEQNHSWGGPENRFVEGLRDVLLSWVDHDLAAARPFVEILLRDEEEIVRRIAIHVLSQRWGVLRCVYLKVLDLPLFNVGHVHEIYGLLREHFQEFTAAEKKATVDVINQLTLPAKGGNPEKRLKYIQRDWLSAVAGKGYEPADARFNELMSDPSLGPLSKHPDFLSYMESWSGPGPSPYSVQELLVFAVDGTIVDRLNFFKPSGSWREPTTRALVQILEAAVQQSPGIFLTLLHAFKHAKREFQYGLINGFKSVWDTAKEKQPQVDWDRAWGDLVDFFEHIIGDPAFWTEDVVEEQDLSPNRNWIPPVISDFLRAGTRDDERAYSQNLLPKTWALIEILLGKSNAVESADEEDPVSQAINSTKGRVIEALFSHALRTCRVSDRTRGDHSDAWALIRPAFDRELAKCVNANYEFSTLAGNYIANIDYIAPDWLRENVGRIFPRELNTNFACALNGLAYAPATRSVYTLLVESGVLDAALRRELNGRHTREKIIERIALGYLWGDDTLELPRFSYLFEAGRVEDLEEASTFFWGVSNQRLTEEQIERVLAYWDRCVVWGRQAPTPPARLLSSLSRLSCYVQSVGAREKSLLESVAPYVNVGYNADEFIEQLVRLVDGNPVEVSDILRQVLDTYIPTFDFEDKIKSLLTKLAEHGRWRDAITYAEKLRNLPGMLQLHSQLTEML